MQANLQNIESNTISCPIITVIIPVYHDWDRLRLCLSSLEKQTCGSDLFEVIVVNNDVNDFIPPLNSPLRLTVLTEEKPGSYAARNRAIENVTTEVIGFTDADCLPDANWIAEAVRSFRGDDNVERLTGPVKIFRELDGNWLAWKFESLTAFNQQYNFKNGVSVTANLFVRKSVFNKVGLFNPNLFSGGDIEWNKRATTVGVNLHLLNSILVMHPARLSMLDLINKARRVHGGEFSQAKQECRLTRYIFRLIAPPLKYAKVLHGDRKSLFDLAFAVTVYWFIKVLMVFEILRLTFGGRPIR